MSNIPKSSAELYTDYTEQIAQNPGVKIGYDEETAESQPYSRKEPKISVETLIISKKSSAKEILSFRRKVIEGDSGEYELAVQELFVRSVSTIFNSIYNQISTNSEYKKYTKKKVGAGIEFLREIEEIKEGGRYEELEASQIDTLVKLLADQKDGADNFPPGIVEQLNRVISRVKKLNSIRDLVEKKPTLLAQIEETQSKLETGKQTGYEIMVSEMEAQAELELAKQRAEIAKQAVNDNIENNQKLEVGLNELRTEQKQIPVDRSIVPRPINTRQVSTETIVKESVAVAEPAEVELIQIESVTQPKVLTNLQLLAQKLEKQKNTTVTEPKAIKVAEIVEIPIVEERESTDPLETKRIENNNKILGNIQGRLNTHYNNLKGVNQILEQLNLFEQTTALKFQPKFKELSTLVGTTFSDMNQRVLILSGLRAMLSTKIGALKQSKDGKKEINLDLSNIETLNLCPAIELSKNAQAAIENKNPNFADQVAKAKALIRIINNFYTIVEQKAEESNSKIPNFHDTFFTYIIRGIHTDYFDQKEHDQFMRSNNIDFEFFVPANWKVKTSSYKLNGNEISAGIDLAQDSRLYVIKSENGNIYFDTVDYQFTHIPENKNRS